MAALNALQNDGRLQGEKGVHLDVNGVPLGIVNFFTVNDPNLTI